MSVYTDVVGVVKVPTRLHTSVRKALEDNLNEVVIRTYKQDKVWDTCEVTFRCSFVQDGMQAAKEIDGFMTAVKGCWVDLAVTSRWLAGTDQ